MEHLVLERRSSGEENMSMHLYELSSKLLGDTVGRVHDNLTSVVLAACVITLLLGYITKLLLSQSCEKDAVSQLWERIVRFRFVIIHYFVCFCRNIRHSYHPAFPSWVMPFPLGKVPLNFLKMHMKK